MWACEFDRAEPINLLMSYENDSVTPTMQTPSHVAALFGAVELLNNICKEFKKAQD